jgi:hypothetical protein
VILLAVAVVVTDCSDDVDVLVTSVPRCNSTEVSHLDVIRAAVCTSPVLLT